MCILSETDKLFCRYQIITADGTVEAAEGKEKLGQRHSSDMLSFFSKPKLLHTAMDVWVHEVESSMSSRVPLSRDATR